VAREARDPLVQEITGPFKRGRSGRPKLRARLILHSESGLQLQRSGTLEYGITMIFDTILPGSRWKTFLPRAALNESQSTLDCSGASAAVARKWSSLARSRRGLPARRQIKMDAVHL
jgi:hypothetical protein